MHACAHFPKQIDNIGTVIGGGWKTVLSVCFKGAFLLMHNSRRKTVTMCFYWRESVC